MPANSEHSAMATGLEKVSFHSNPKESESEVAQSCPTLCDHMNCSLPGSSLHGILQARALKWVAISFFLHGILQARVLEWVAISFFLHGILQARVLEWVTISFSRVFS